MDAQRSNVASRQALLAGVAVALIAGVAILALALRGTSDSQSKGSSTTQKERVLGVTVTRSNLPAAKKSVPSTAPTSAPEPPAPASSASQSTISQSSGRTSGGTTSGGTTSGGTTSGGTMSGGTTATTIITSTRFETVPTTAAPRRAAGRVTETSDNSVGFNTRPQAPGGDIGTAITFERQDPNWFGFTIDAPRRDGGVVLTAVVSNTNEQTLTFPGGLAVTFNLTGSNGAVQSYTVRQPSITTMEPYTQLQIEQFITLAPDDYTMRATTLVDYP